MFKLGSGKQPGQKLLQKPYNKFRKCQLNGSYFQTPPHHPRMAGEIDLMIELTNLTDIDIGPVLFGVELAVPIW